MLDNRLHPQGHRKIQPPPTIDRGGFAWWVDPQEHMVGVFLAQRRLDVLGIPAFVLDFWTSAYQLIDD